MAVLADAFDIQEGKIYFTPDSGIKETKGFITNLTINNRRPEDFINVIGGQVRRRKPEEVDWSTEGCVLYNNLKDLQDLMMVKFEIELTMTNPEDGSGQVLRLSGCRIAEQSININDSSMVNLSGRANLWKVDNITP